MGPRVPQLVAAGVAAVPAEPPCPHRGSDPGHVGAHGYLHAAVAENPVAVLGLLIALINDARGVVEGEQRHPGLGPCCNATTTCCGSGAISGLKNLPNGVSASSLR